MLNAGTVGLNRAKVIDGLRARFARGTTLTVGTYVSSPTDVTQPYHSVWAAWTGSGLTSGISLLLGAVDGGWYWVGEVTDRSQ